MKWVRILMSLQFFGRVLEGKELNPLWNVWQDIKKKLDTIKSLSWFDLILSYLLKEA